MRRTELTAFSIPELLIGMVISAFVFLAVDTLIVFSLSLVEYSLGAHSINAESWLEHAELFQMIRTYDQIENCEDSISFCRDELMRTFSKDRIRIESNAGYITTFEMDLHYQDTLCHVRVLKLNSIRELIDEQFNKQCKCADGEIQII